MVFSFLDGYYTISYIVGIYGNRFGFGLFGSGDGCRGFSDMVLLSARGQCKQYGENNNEFYFHGSKN